MNTTKFLCISVAAIGILSGCNDHTKDNLTPGAAAGPALGDDETESSDERHFPPLASQTAAELRSTIRIPIEQQSGEVRQTVPVITQLGKGTFDDEGLGDVFRRITALGMSDEVQPITGWYSVYDVHDSDGRYRMEYHGLYTTTPDRARELLSDLKAEWQKEYAHRPEWKVVEGVATRAGDGGFGMKITEGCVGIQVYRPDSPIQETYEATIDPITGMMLLRFMGGPVDD